MKRQKLTLESVKAHYYACAKHFGGQALEWKEIQEVFAIKQKLYKKISVKVLVELGILIPRSITKRTVRRGKGFYEFDVQNYSVRQTDVDILSLWKELKRLQERSCEYAAKSNAKRRSKETHVEPVIEPVVEETSEVQLIPTLPEYNDLYEAIKIIKKYGGKVIFE